MPEVLSAMQDKFFAALNESTDATCVIVGTSHIEHALRSLLRKKLVKCNTALNLLDPSKGALGLLHNSVCMAYALGLISERCMKNIETIGAIRNLFAHSIDDTFFTTADVTKLCEELSFPRVDMGESGWGSVEECFASFPVSCRSRSRFTFIAGSICMGLIEAAKNVDHVKTKSDQWDA